MMLRKLLVAAALLSLTACAVYPPVTQTWSAVDGVTTYGTHSYRGDYRSVTTGYYPWWSIDYFYLGPRSYYPYTTGLYGGFYPSRFYAGSYYGSRWHAPYYGAYYPPSWVSPWYSRSPYYGRYPYRYSGHGSSGYRPPQSGYDNPGAAPMPRAPTTVDGRSNRREDGADRPGVVRGVDRRDYRSRDRRDGQPIGAGADVQVPTQRRISVAPPGGAAPGSAGTTVINRSDGKIGINRPERAAPSVAPRADRAMPAARPMTRPAERPAASEPPRQSAPARSYRPPDGGRARREGPRDAGRPRDDSDDGR